MKDKLKLIENSKERLKDQIRNTKYIENAAGFLQTIDTLTAISADIVTQKFYEIKISDYIPVKVGANPWLEQSLTWKTFSIGGSFESGIIETGSYNAKAESMDTQFESVITKRKVWKKGIVYNLAELSQANASTMIDLITQKEIARKTKLHKRTST